MDRRRRSALPFVAALLATVALPAPARADDPLLGDGAIVLFRHADAPGIGDPPNFRLDDCGTQRNLGDEGRRQAQRIGESLRARSVKVGEVRSSPWCRTRETARLAFPAAIVRDDADFASFFGEPDAAPAQTTRAAESLRRWHGPGVLVVFTHQVNITALTGIVPASGEGVVVRATESGLAVTGRIRPR